MAFPFADILVDGSVLNSDEYANLSSFGTTLPKARINRYLLDSVSLKKKALRRKFVNLLASNQPVLWLPWQQKEHTTSHSDLTVSVSDAQYDGRRGSGTGPVLAGSAVADSQLVTRVNTVDDPRAADRQSVAFASPAHNASPDHQPVITGSPVCEAPAADSRQVTTTSSGHNAPTDHQPITTASPGHNASADRKPVTTTSSGNDVLTARQPVMTASQVRDAGAADGQQVGTTNPGHNAATNPQPVTPANPGHDAHSGSQPVKATASSATSFTHIPTETSSHQNQEQSSVVDSIQAAPGQGVQNASGEGALENATFVDWEALLDAVSSDQIRMEHTCISLASQLRLQRCVDADIMRHLRVRYPNDYSSMAADLFRLWLCTPAALAMNDSEKEGFLRDVFNVRMRSPELTISMENWLSLPTYRVQGPPEVSQPDLHSEYIPWARHRSRITPTVRKYLESLVNEADRMSNVTTIDYYDGEDTECIDDVYVSVTSLSYSQAWKLLKQQGRGDAKELAQSASTSMADKPGGIELVNLEVLLKRKRDLAPIDRTLVLGGGGAGKTILCSKIAYDWKRPKRVGGFKKFDAVIYIAGRDAARVMAGTERQFLALPERHTDSQCQEIIDFLADNAKNVLFLIDGGDEVGGRGLLEEGEVLRELLCGRGRFAQASVILTSRPSDDVFRVLRECNIKRLFSLIGLKGNRLQELACRRLDPAEATRFNTELSTPEKAQVKSAAQETPLFAAMLIRVFDDEGKLPLSVTDLYKHVFDNVIHRNARRIVERNTKRREQEQTRQGAPTRGYTSRTSQFYDEAPARSYLLRGAEGLGKLALDGLMYKRFTFTSNYMERFRGAEDVGFLRTMKDPGSQVGCKMYTFTHLSWQEYLAARELAKSAAFSISLRTALEKIGHEEHTWLFWRFVAGLLPSILLQELIISLSIALKAHEKSVLSRRRIFFLLTCLAEQRQPDSASHFSIATSWLFPSRNIQVSCYPASLCEWAALAFALERSPRIGGLHVSQCWLDGECIKVLVPALHRLSAVHIHGNRISGEGVSCIARSFDQSSSTLRSVYITQCQLKDDDAAALGTIVNGCPYLEKVNFSRNELGPKGVQTFFAHINDSSGCESVDLSYNNLEGLDGTACGRALSRLTQMMSLDLSNCCLADTNVDALLTELRSSEHLKALIFKSNALTAKVLPIIGRFMSTSQSKHAGNHLSMHAADESSLQFHLHGNSISASDMEHAVSWDLLPHTCRSAVFCGTLCMRMGCQSTVDILKALTERESPDFFDWGISDDFAEHVATLLCDSAAAEVTSSLELRKNKIADNGATAIATCLCINSTLQSLGLCSNLIGPAGGDALATSLSMHNTSLVYLNLSQNGIFTMEPSSQGCFETLLCKCNSLKALLLEETGLSAYHCEHLSPGSHFGANLIMLSLCYNSVGDAGAARLAGLIASSQTLIYLSLSKNKLTTQGVKVLASAVAASTLCPQLACVWLGGNSIPDSYFDDCPCHSFVSVESSLLLYKADFIMDEYLFVRSTDSDIKLARKASSRAILTNSSLVEALEECTGSENVDSFACLVFRVLRCLNLTMGAPPGTAEYHNGLRVFYGILARCFAGSNGDMEFVVGASLLCALDLRAVVSEQVSDGEMQNALGVLSQLHARSPHSTLIQFLDRLVELCRELRLHEVSRLLSDQKEVIRSGMLLF